MAHTELYEILEVSPTATTQEINKAYKKLATRLHPDKNPSPDAKQRMTAVNQAREILIDEEKRKIYDRHGLEGLKNTCHGGDGDVPFDIFNMFFGGGPGGSKRKKTKQLQIDISLEEIFNGCKKTESVRMTCLCTKCNGQGASAEHIQKCSTCKGEGRILLQQGSMVMVQSCGSCGGDGQRVPRDKVCPNCGGSGTVNEQVKLEFEVKKGVQDGETMLMKDMGGVDNQKRVTDLMIIFKTIPHKQFKRNGEDLIMDMEISISESLTGFSRRIKTIGGTDIILNVPTGQFTPHGFSRIIKGYGLPVSNYPGRIGDLVLTFQVKYPVANEISVESLIAIEKLLPKKSEVNRSNATAVTSELQAKTSKRDQGSNSSRASRGGTFFTTSNFSHDDHDDDSEHVQFGSSQCQPT